MEEPSPLLQPARKDPPLQARFGAFQHRNFRLLLLGAVCMYSGVWIQLVAQGWLVLELTNSALFLGVVSFSQAISNLAMGPLGGVIIDRTDKRRLLLVVETSYFLLLLLLGTLIVAGLINIWQIIAITVIYGGLLAFNQPTVQALIPILVDKEDLTNAVATNNSAWNAASVIGPAVAAFLVVQTGVGALFFLSAAGYLAIIIALGAIKTQPTAKENIPSATVSKDLRKGLAYILRNRAVLALILISMIPNLFGLPFLVVLPVFARDLLAVGASGLGWLTTAFGIGAFGGSAVVVLFSNLRRKGWALILSTSIFGLLIVLFSLSRSYSLALLILAGVGLTYGLILALGNSLLQSIVVGEVRGRVMGIYTLTWTLMPAGGLIIAAISDKFGAPTAVAIGGIITTVFAAAAAIKTPELRGLD